MNNERINLKELIELETGNRFNKNNKMCCVFHNERTPSFSYNPKTNKAHCFGCGKHIDSIQFIRDYKNMTYIDACNYLGIEVNEKYKAIATEEEKVSEYINWCLDNKQDLKEWKLIKLYRFTDENNNTLYFTAKFSTPGKKEIRYFSIRDGKVEWNRNSEPVPYNNYYLVKALRERKPIFIVEGEKDADTIIHMGYTATSLKGIKDIPVHIFQGADIYSIADTGQVGTEYQEKIWNSLKDTVNHFRVVELPNLEVLGDNADVTDWFKDGHTKEEFKEAIKDHWDWKVSRLWKYLKPVQRNNEIVYVPLKIWQNLSILLKREGIYLKYNQISKEVESTGKLTGTRNILLTDIYTLSQLKGLNMSREEVKNSIDKIAFSNCYNPFIEYLEKNQNDNYKLIDDVFKCININQEFGGNIELYKTYFTKWLLNVVRMAHNTLENAYESQGVLVLQGGQGAYKSTFCKTLLPYNKWFKGGKSIDPTNKDSIKENTKYILVELGELDSTLKGDQAKLKAFITADSDEYRSPYATYEEKHPRITSYCATVNKRDFLKDETGSRRFWIIPTENCDIEKMKDINIDEFWGAVYSLYKSEKVTYWLTKEENEALINSNMNFNVENDISIALDETFNWEQNKIAWKVYTVTELCNILEIKEKKALKNEMERRNFKYKAHRDNYHSKPKSGYKLPNINQKEAKRLKDELDTVPF